MSANILRKIMKHVGEQINKTLRTDIKIINDDTESKYFALDTKIFHFSR